ncbi:MAG: cytochrome c-type biogenesis protein [Halopseudomonas sp.]
MKQMMQLMAVLGLLIASWSVQAVIDTYDFNTEQQHEQYKLLTEELRCPKCQNQNLADSNAPIAADMRREIHRMVIGGQTNQDVVDFMVARYGDFVNYRPRKDSSTMVLWYGPIGMLAIGALVVLLLTRRKRSATSQADKSAGDTLDREKLQRLLDDKDAR